MNFGEHVTIDGYGGNEDLLNNRETVISAIEDLCTKLGMHKLIDTQIILAPDNDIKDPGGWSAFVMIAESHIAIHTFPKRRFVSADVYTCKNGMDVQLIVDFFKEKFALQDVEEHFIQRGTRYPDHNVV